MASFLEFYLFDRPSPVTGKTPAAGALRAAAGPDQRAAAFRGFTETIHGLFEVRKLGKGEVRLRELFSGKDFDVTERRQLAGLEKGDLLEARLIPFDGHLWFSSAFCYHPREAVEGDPEGGEAAQEEGAAPHPEGADLGLREARAQGRSLPADRGREDLRLRELEDLSARRAARGSRAAARPRRRGSASKSTPKPGRETVKFAICGCLSSRWLRPRAGDRDLGHPRVAAGQGEGRAGPPRRAGARARSRRTPRSRRAGAPAPGAAARRRSAAGPGDRSGSESSGRPRSDPVDGEHVRVAGAVERHPGDDHHRLAGAAERILCGTARAPAWSIASVEVTRATWRPSTPQ